MLQLNDSCNKRIVRYSISKFLNHVICDEIMVKSDIEAELSKIVGST